MKLTDDFIKFLAICNAMRNGTLEERKAVHESEENTKFLLRVTEEGLLDTWLSLADDIFNRVNKEDKV